PKSVSISWAISLSRSAESPLFRPPLRRPGSLRVVHRPIARRPPNRLPGVLEIPSRFDLPPHHRRLFGRDIAGTGLALDLLREEEVRTMGCLRIVLTGAGSLSALHPAFTERTSSHRFRMREGCC